MFLRKVDSKFPNKILKDYIAADNDVENRCARVKRLERRMLIQQVFQKIKHWGKFLIVVPFIIFFLQLSISYLRF
jgi:hypothetical protein